MKRLVGYVRPYWHRYAFATLCTLGTVTLGMVLPYLTGKAIDAIQAHNSSRLTLLAGEIVAVHRKVYLPTYGMFDEQRYFAQGSEIRAFDSRFGRGAMLICEDLWHPSTAYLAALDDALALLETAERGAVEDLQRCRVQLLRAQIAFVSTHGSDAPAMLLDAARRLEPLSPGLAHEVYLEALSAAIFAGHLATPGGSPQDVSLAATQCGEHTHLTVLQLAQPTTPLACHASRVLALLHETGLVDQQATIGLATKQSLRFRRHLTHRRLVVPRRMAQEVLQPLVVGVRHDFGHPLHVLASGLDQATEILFGLDEHASGAGTEMWCEASDDGNEAVGQLDERFRWRADVGRAVFALRARFATPAGLLGGSLCSAMIRNIANKHNALNVTK